MFEQVLSVPEEDSEKEDVTNELMLCRAISAIQQAQITSNDGNYTITIQCQSNRMPSEPVFLYPLGCDGKEQVLADGLTFKDMALDSLTEFYTIRIGDLRRLIKYKRRECQPMRETKQYSVTLSIRKESSSTIWHSC